MYALLPGHFMSDKPSQESIDSSFDVTETDNNGRTKSKRGVSGFKIMTMTRGFTEEADKLLDYLVCMLSLFIYLAKVPLL
jgi:hypothetical protein